jgi:hypothetical protein
MARKAKLLAAMRANPNGDWTIADLQAVCAFVGISCKAPKRGSHFTLSHPATRGLLTVPARRPIKPIYIRLLLEMVDSLERI